MSNIVSSDPVADMLARIRNANAVNRQEVSMPHSKMKEAVAKTLKAAKFVEGVHVNGEGTEKTLTIALRGEREASRITEITRLSKPGRRHYASVDAIPVVMRGRGIVIVSTSKGLMTGAEAKKQGLGGELICKVY